MSDDGNESRDSKNTEADEKSTPASPSHVAETKSKGITIYLVILLTQPLPCPYLQNDCVFRRWGGGGPNWSCVDF